MENSRLADVIRFLDENGAFGTSPGMRELEPPDRSPLIHSWRIGGDLYRLKSLGPTSSADGWLFLEEAKAAWRSLQSHAGLVALCPNPIPKLARQERLLVASPALPIVPGPGPDQDADEFILFQVPVPDTAAGALEAAGEELLGVLLALSVRCSEADPLTSPSVHSCVLALSGCCRLSSFELDSGRTSLVLGIRLNCGRLLEVFPQLAAAATDARHRSYQLQLFVASSL